MTAEELFKKISLLISDSGISHVVFTGGEPTMFIDRLVWVASKLSETFGFIRATFETNGENVPDSNLFVEENEVEYIWSISPKGPESNSGALFNQGHIEDWEDFFFDQCSDFDHYFKFVYTNAKDGEWILKMIRDFPELQAYQRIYVMPEGVTRDAINRKAEEVVDFCIKNNLKYAPREHINIWNDRQGV